MKFKRYTQKFGHLPVPQVVYNPWDIMQVDLFGPWRFEDMNGITREIKAVSMIDPMTRWIELADYTSKTSENISFIVDREWLLRYPRPSEIIFDNGTEFSSEFYELLHSYGITPRPTTIKHPQANAIVERIHLVIADSLRTMDLENQPFDDT